MRRSAPALLLLAALGLAACGTETLDQGELEDEIAGSLAKQVGEKPKLSCPPDQEVAKGRRFECGLTAKDGSKARVRVTLVDDEGGFRYEVLAPAA